jgi:hypothetical protein
VPVAVVVVDCAVGAIEPGRMGAILFILVFLFPWPRACNFRSTFLHRAMNSFQSSGSSTATTLYLKHIS